MRQYKQIDEMLFNINNFRLGFHERLTATLDRFLDRQLVLITPLWYELVFKLKDGVRNG